MAPMTGVGIAVTVRETGTVTGLSRLGELIVIVPV
jgi:hypothetical protein